MDNSHHNHSYTPWSPGQQQSLIDQLIRRHTAAAHCTWKCETKTMTTTTWQTCQRTNDWRHQIGHHPGEVWLLILHIMNTHHSTLQPSQYSWHKYNTIQTSRVLPDNLKQFGTCILNYVAFFHFMHVTNKSGCWTASQQHHWASIIGDIHPQR